MVRAPPLKTPGDAAAAPLGRKPSSPARATPHPLFRLWACVAWSQDLEWVTSLRRGGGSGEVPHIPEAKFPMCYLRSPAKGSVTFT